MSFSKIVARGLKTGCVLTATTSASMLIAGQCECGSPWAAVNCVSHIIDGDEKEQPTDFSPRESLLGLAINAAAMLAWGVCYETGLALTGLRRNAATGALAAAAAWFTDYRIVPKRFTPGIEKRLSSAAIAAAYAVIGATFACSEIWNTEDRN